MHRMLVLILAVAVAVPAMAVEDGQVTYVGGTVPNLKAGTAGQLDTTAAKWLRFEAGESSVQIPYASVISYDYTRKLAHNLGIAPTLAVAMVKRLQRRHFVRISYRDAAGVAQAAVFEVPKQMPQMLMALLQTRAPQGCQGPVNAPCRRW